MLIDRDATPEICKRFAVSAYPSVLVLGPEHENIWRWSSFMPPGEFLGELDEALRRFTLFRQDERFDAPPARPPVLLADALVETWPAPSDEVPWGVVRLDDAHWVGRGKTLFELDAASHEVRRRLEVGVHQDLCTDGTHLWLLPADWTTGGAIRVADPATGETVREVVTEANRGQRGQGARGIAWYDGKLWVLEIRGRLHAIDPQTGAVTATAETGLDWVFGLCVAGDALVTGSRTGLHWIDPKTMKATRAVPTNHPLRGLGFDEDRYLCQEQPIFGFDRNHDRVRWHPDPTVLHAVTLLPEGNGVQDGTLTVSIVCDALGTHIPAKRVKVSDTGEMQPLEPERSTLVGHRVHTEIGNVRYETTSGLARALRALHARVGNMPVVVAPQKGSTYSDVADVVDAIDAAGFAEINFRGG